MNQSAAPGKINGVTVLVDPNDISPFLTRGKKTVVLFEMTGCPFCRAFQSAFLHFAEKRSEDCALVRVKLDKYDNPLGRKYEIEAVSAVIIFANGEIQSRLDVVPGLGLSKKKWTDFCTCFKWNF